MGPFHRILCPVDFSEGSDAALEYALFLSERFGAKVDLVHVWQVPYAVRPDLMVFTEVSTARSLYEGMRDQAQAELTRQLDAIPEGVRGNVTGRLLHGETVSALLDLLAKGEHDLVVMGTHGRTGLSHAVMGSVAERVVRRSPVPVLTLPKRAAEAAPQAGAS
jgi:nucleotide-binding universal stress UspA family protein